MSSETVGAASYRAEVSRLHGIINAAREAIAAIDVTLASPNRAAQWRGGTLAARNIMAEALDMPAIEAPLRADRKTIPVKPVRDPQVEAMVADPAAYFAAVRARARGNR